MAEDENINCERCSSGFSSSDMVLSGCLSFIAGISVMLLFIFLMKLKTERKLCFREKEEPCRGKWEGASKRATLQVLKKHSLESSQSDATREKRRSISDCRVKYSVADSSVVHEMGSSKPEADEHVTIRQNNSTKTKDSLHDSARSSKSQLTTKQHGQKVAVESKNETSVTMPVDKEEVQDSPTDHVALSCAADLTMQTNHVTDAELHTNTNEPIEQTSDEPKEEKEQTDVSCSYLEVDNLFERERSSSVFEPPQFVIQNDNFRMSVLSIS